LATSIGSARAPGGSVAAIASISPETVGTYIITVTTNRLGGVSLPESFTLEALCYNSIVSPVAIDLEYDSRDLSQGGDVNPSDSLSGDHILLSASYPSFSQPLLPEADIIDIAIYVQNGQYVERDGDAAFDIDFNWPLDPGLTSSYAMEIIEDIESGATVEFELELSNDLADPALVVYEYAGTTPSSSDTPLLILNSGGSIETGSFVAANDMDLFCCIYSHPYTEVYSDTYELKMDTRDGISATSAGRFVTIDTYDLLQNGEYDVRVVARTATGVEIVTDVSSVYFENYFAPNLGSVEVDVDDMLVAINWTVADENVDDEHFFEVLVSSDGGTTYDVVSSRATHGNSPSYTWNSNGQPLSDNYTIMVRCWDNDPTLNPGALASGEFWPGLYDEATSATFTAGSRFPPIVDLLPLLIAVSGIAVVVIVLVVFYVKKRQ
jgi:hypothetical protein